MIRERSHTMKIVAAMGGEGFPLLPIGALLEVWYGEMAGSGTVCPCEA